MTSSRLHLAHCSRHRESRRTLHSQPHLPSFSGSRQASLCTTPGSRADRRPLPRFPASFDARCSSFPLSPAPGSTRARRPRLLFFSTSCCHSFTWPAPPDPSASADLRSRRVPLASKARIKGHLTSLATCSPQQSKVPQASPPRRPRRTRRSRTAPHRIASRRRQEAVLQGRFLCERARRQARGCFGANWEAHFGPPSKHATK